MSKTITKTSELTNLVLSNANEPTALKVSTIKEKYPKYCAGVEALRLAASRYACGVIDNTITAEQREGQVNAFFALYKAVLSQLAVGSKVLKAQANDFESILAIVGTYRKNRETGKREFFPTSANTFRNNFEKFVAHRINGELSKDAETIEAERKTKNALKREQRKAEKAKAKAEAEKNAAKKTAKKAA